MAAAINGGRTWNIFEAHAPTWYSSVLKQLSQEPELWEELELLEPPVFEPSSATYVLAHWPPITPDEPQKPCSNMENWPGALP